MVSSITFQLDALRQTMWTVHVLWFIQAFIFPSVTVAFLNYRQPSTKVFLSSIFCKNDDDDTCPRGIVAASMFFQTMFLLYAYLATYFMDLLPMTAAVSQTLGFEVGHNFISIM